MKFYSAPLPGVRSTMISLCRILSRISALYWLLLMMLLIVDLACGATIPTASPPLVVPMLASTIPAVVVIGSSSKTPSTGLLAVRVTRNENGPDSFTSNKITTCNGLDYCSKAKAAVVVEDSKECMCRCPMDSPVFQDDVGACVPQIPESSDCRFQVLSEGARQEINPTVQLPPFGHTITRKINLTFTESNSARQCIAVECQFLSTDGWSSLSTIRLGSQPPRLRLVQSPSPSSFWQQQQILQQPSLLETATNSAVYNLQWLGSSEHSDFLQGRLIILTAVCNATGLPPISVCVPMRVAGTSGRVHSSALMEQQQPGGGGADADTVETGVLVAAACGGALGVLYVIVLAIFVASRLRKRRKVKHNNTRQHIVDGHDNLTCEHNGGNNNGSTGKLAAADVEHGGNAAHSPGAHGAAAYSAWSEEFAGRQRCVQPRGMLAAPNIPARFLFSPPPFFLNDVLIVQTPDALHKDTQIQDVIHKRVEHKLLPKPPIRRRKVFFDPEYLNVELLKNPPDAAENFRAQIHCMVNITKSRLDRRRFLPHLEMIDEDQSLRRTIHETMMLGHHQLLQLSEGTNQALVIMDSCIKDTIPDRGTNTGQDLDAVVLQVKVRPISTDEKDLSMTSSDIADLNPSNWSQILKDEWGSNESLAKVPLRRRIQDIFHTNTAATDAAKNGRPLSRASPIVETKAKMPLQRSKLKTVEGRAIAPVKAASDDEESDKASSKSGTGSSPEKDSGIEDDVNSDKSDKKTSSSHNGGGKTDAPVMISRKKIVSASTVVGITSLQSAGRGRAGGVHPLPAF